MPDTLEAWLSRLEKRHFKAIDLGLDRCGAVWERMGRPRPAARVITVAGTNGKGSAVAFLDALIRSAGFRCGAYTSPHLLRFNERLRINGEEATDQQLVGAFEQTEAALEGDSLSYFEFTTLAAFALLREACLDYAVLEVGLGGRLDAVNLVDPDSALIMPIGLDHQQYLGDDIESIGFEKAGIMRPGIPVTCGQPDPPRSIVAHAEKLGASLSVAGRDFHVEAAGEYLAYRDRYGALDVPQPPLPGAHQVTNLAAAIAALRRVAPDILNDGHDWKSAISRLRLPGRLSPHPADRRLILDVGHNPAAAGVMALHLHGHGRRRTHAVMGMLADKDAEGVARTLSPDICRWYCCGLGGSRGQQGRALATRIRKAVPGIMAAQFQDVATGLDHARKEAGPEDRILVFGSFETVSAALRILDGNG